MFYGDYECPHCAKVDLRLRAAGVRVCFRHFPVRSAHPRARAAAAAAEAAALQGAFWEMHDALFADQGRLEDPHLWARAERLGLDVRRFDSDRRSETVAARVEAAFRGGVRAGVATTPTLFLSGARVDDPVSLLASLESAGGMDDITNDTGQDAGEHAGKPTGGDEPRTDRDAGGPTADPDAPESEGGIHGRPSPFEPHE